MLLQSFERLLKTYNYSVM